MAGFLVSCLDQNLEVVRETAEVEPEGSMEAFEDVSMTEVKQNGIVKVSAVATAVRSRPVSTPVAEVLSQVPFQYTHNRLGLRLRISRKYGNG